MVEEISDSFSTVPLISLIAPTDSCVAAWMPEICWPISPVAFAVCSASAFTSDHHRKATASLAGPRRFDGRVQGQQVGLTGNGIDQFDDVTDAGGGLRQFADAVVGLACASLAIRADSCTWRLISLTDDVSSSVADATD